ncbi:MAG: ACT domain-containing protein [Sedimentisphaeraceae bacterium JB056]
MAAKKIKKAENKESQICIVTVTGQDKVGIIARLSSEMAKAGINIVDVNQKIMENYFVMTMACDIAGATVGMKEIKESIARIAEDMELRITFQHEDIFAAMHRV